MLDRLFTVLFGELHSIKISTIRKQEPASPLKKGFRIIDLSHVKKWVVIISLPRKSIFFLKHDQFYRMLSRLD